MVAYEDIFEAYFECRKKKRGKKTSLEFEMSYEAECVSLANEINNRTYEIGTSIAFFVQRPKKREVFAANFRDRVVHHWLALRLEPLFENLFIEDTYSCRKDKGTQYGIKCLKEKIEHLSNNYTEDCYVSKFDLQGFFMSIDKEILWTKLKHFIEENYKNTVDFDDVLWIAEKIVKHCPEKDCIKRSPESWWIGFPEDKSLFTCGEGKGLPIGNLTSQLFANFYMHEFDSMMIEKFGDGYGRYVDDFFIIAKDKQEILNFINPMKKFLFERLHVKLHHKKMYLQHCSKGVKFIGGVVKQKRIYTGNETITNFSNAIDDINKNYRKYTIEDIVCRLNSYFGFLRHTKSFNIRKRMFLKLNLKVTSKLYCRGFYESVVIKKKFKKKNKLKIKIRSLIKNSAEF